MSPGCVWQKRAQCLLTRSFRVEHLEALDQEHLRTATRHPSRLTFTPLFSLGDRFSKSLVLNGWTKEPAQGPDSSKPGAGSEPDVSADRERTPALRPRPSAETAGEEFGHTEDERGG